MNDIMPVLHILSFLAGIALVIFTVFSAVRMLVLPRSDNVWLTRQTFLFMQRLFRLRIRLLKAYDYGARDRLMAFFAPLTLLLMPVIWLTLITIGYTLMFWALGAGDGSFYHDLHLSGSSLLTLGFVQVDTLPEMLLAFSEAVFGLGMVALLLAYLPTMYSAFSRREKYVAMLAVRAGDPPDATTLILRLHRNMGFEYLDAMWADWEEWFIELEESHTSLAPLIFFRSPQPERSWITAAGTVLDTFAIVDAALDRPRNIRGALAMRAGFVALRRIADFFDMAYDPDPTPGDPISVTQEEFFDVWDTLEADGVALKPSGREQAWHDFAGWRVNYDAVLVKLARMTMAPYAPWISDRSVLSQWED